MKAIDEGKDMGRDGEEKEERRASAQLPLHRSMRGEEDDEEAAIDFSLLL